MRTCVPGYMRLIVNNAFNLGSGSFTSNLYTKIQNAGVSDDFTVIRGSHQFGFGGHYLWTKSDSVANAWSVGSCLHRPVHQQRDGGLLRRPRRLPPSGQREPSEGDAAGGRRLLSGLLETQPGHSQLRCGMESVPANELL